MKLRPLLLSPETSAIIAGVVAYAEANRIPLAMMKQLVANPGLAAVGDNPHRCCIIPFGYRCAFSIEEHPMGWCRHLSVSVDGDGVAPNTVAVHELMKLFGYKDVDFCLYFTESIAGSNKVAVNVIEKL